MNNKFYTPGANYNPYPAHPIYNYQFPQYQSPMQQPQINQVQQQQSAIQQTSIQAIYINGIEGAKAFQLAPNQQVCLLDDDNSMIYFKEADNQGKATLKAFKMQETNLEEVNKPVDTSQFVTKSEFDTLNEKIDKILNSTITTKKPIKKSEQPETEVVDNG